MNRSLTFARRWRTSAVLLALGMPVLSGAQSLAGARMPRPLATVPAVQEMEEEKELPHPFFTHMGLPEGVGVWNLRSAALATRAEGKTEGDFAFHLETGITERIGLHIRNDRFLDMPKTEAMFQFAAFTSADGMSGFAPLIEFEIPTRSEGDNRINTLVGFTSTLASPRVAFNQALHYDPREDGVDASAALVVGVGERFFPVLEILGEGATGERPIVNLLAGLKVRVREGIVLGLAYQLPVSSRKDFSSQLIAMPELEWVRGR